MKKVASLALAALMTATLAASVNAANTFEAATGTPTIDGKMDDAYKAATAVKIANTASATADKKTSGTAYTLWDNNNIYVFFDIVDPLVSTKTHSKYVADAGTYMYESDSVEFFLNLSGQATGDVTVVNAAQYTAPAPGLGITANLWSGRGKQWDACKAKSTYATVKTDKGYAVEMQIAWGADFTPKADAEIGVVYHINSDENTTEGRDAEYFAGDAEAQGQAWSKVDSYDTLKLTSKKYEAPKPAETTKEAAKTADMGVISAVAALAASGAAVLSLKKRK